MEAALAIQSSVGGNNRTVLNNKTWNFDNGGGTLTFNGGNHLFQGGGSTHNFDVTAAGSGSCITSINGGFMNMQGSGNIEFDVADGAEDRDLTLSATFNNGLITKDGAGTLAITGTHNGSYAIDINAGTLEVGNAATLAGGTFTAAIANDGTYKHNSSANQTISGVISGSGAVIKDNTGTLTLSGLVANTYSGGTTINDGIVSLGTGGGAPTSHQDALGTGSVTVNSGGELRLWIENSGTYTIDNAITLDGGTVHGEDGIYDLTGGMTLNAGGGTLSGKWIDKGLNVSGTISGTGALTIDEVAGGSGSEVTLSGTNTFSGNVAVNNGTLVTSGSSGRLGANTAGRTVTVDGATSVLDVASTNSIVANHSTENDITLVAQNGGTIRNSGGALNRIGDVTLDGGDLEANVDNVNWGSWYFGTRNGGQDATVSVSGSAASTISGTGNIALGANTQFNVADATGDAATDLTVSAILATGAASGHTGGFTKLGAGTMELTGVNTYTGDTTISAGTLEIGGAGQLGSGSYAGAISNSGIFEYNSSAAQTLSGVISGAGSVLKDNTGTLTLTANNNFSGGTTVDGGTLQLTVDGRIGNGGLTVNNGGTFSIANDDFNSLGGAITVNEGGTLSTDSTGNNAHNIGAITLNGGTLTSSGNTWSQGNWIFNGDVTVGGSALSTISGLAVGSQPSGGTFNVDDSVAGASTDLLVSADITLGSLTKTGTGTMELTGANTYSGTTTVSAGTLALNGAADNSRIAGDANTATFDVTISGGTLRNDANEQIADTASITMSSGAYSLNGATETIDGFTNSGGTFTTGTGTLIGLGNTITWSGGTNTINDGGTVQDQHFDVSGGTNTVEGGTTGGTLRVQSGGTGFEFTGTGTPNVTLNSDATNAGRMLLEGNLTVADTITGTATISNGGAAANSGFIDMNGGTRTFTVNDATPDIDLEISALITNGGLIKAGTGTMELTGVNTYDGGTDINAGTLLINASNAGAIGDVNINSGGTLGGTGSIGGATTLNSGGFLSPGDGGTGDTLSFLSSLDITDASAGSLAL